MNEVTGQVLDYLEYKNKTKTAEWEERLWRHHLNGAPRDFRPNEDRERYFGLLERAQMARQVAQKLHLRRTAHAPRFAQYSANGG